MKEKRKMPFGLKFLIIFLCIFLLNWIVLGLLVHQNVIPQNTLPIVSLIVGMLDFFLLGFLLGNHVQQKGIWVGLASGLLLSLVFCLIALLGYEKFTMKLTMKLIIYVVASGLGGAFGVNIKQIIK